MLPGYRPVTAPGPFAEEYPNLPQTPGKDLIEMFDAAERGELGALYVVGANPVARYNVDPASLKNTFVIVQEMFLTETAQIADVVLPAANLYEKGGSVTNNYGDLQLVKKAGDRAGVRTDLELIVRLADRMGAKPQQLVPFGRGLRADTGQSRGAQSGEADRHAIWLASRQIEPKVSPFDPYAVLDEIARLVPGYDVERMNLLAGNDVRTKLVSIETRGPDHTPRSCAARTGCPFHLRHTGPLQRQTGRSSRIASQIPCGNRGRLNPTKHWQLRLKEKRA